MLYHWVHVLAPCVHGCVAVSVEQKVSQLTAVVWDDDLGSWSGHEGVYPTYYWHCHRGGYV